MIPVSGGMTERQVSLITDFKPEIIMVTPSYMLAILDEFRAKNIDPRTSSLKIGIFGAEPWTNSMRKEIEDTFDMDAVDIYGLSEVMGPGVANECVETKDGLHIWEDHFYPEIVDPVSGKVLPDGEIGELVFTSLTKEAMPVIRYRTRDLTRLMPGTARSMRRMEKVTGRSDDMMIVRGVNVFPTQFEEQLAALRRSWPRTSTSNCTANSGSTPCGCMSKRVPTTPMMRRARRRRRCSSRISAASSASASPWRSPIRAALNGRWAKPAALSTSGRRSSA